MTYSRSREQESCQARLLALCASPSPSHAELSEAVMRTVDLLSGDIGGQTMIDSLSAYVADKVPGWAFAPAVGWDVMYPRSASRGSALTYVDHRGEHVTLVATTPVEFARAVFHILGELQENFQDLITRKQDGIIGDILNRASAKLKDEDGLLSWENGPLVLGEAREAYVFLKNTFAQRDFQISEVREPVFRPRIPAPDADAYLERPGLSS